MTAAAGRSGFTDGFYTSQDGLRLYYRDYDTFRGASTPVLCLTGLTRNSKDFAELARRLAVSRRVVCPDLRGRGRSQYDRRWRRYNARTYLDDIRHLLAALNLHRVVIVGTSLGGILAMAMTAAMPSAVAGAVLNDVGPEIASEGLGRIASYVGDSRRHADWEAAARHLRGIQPDLPADNDEDWMGLARRTYREDGEGGIYADWDTALAKPLLRDRHVKYDLWPLFRGLRRVPLVAVRGALSDVLSVPTFERMAGELANLVAVTVAGVGHAPGLGEPEVLKAIDALLAEVDGT